MIGDIVGGIVGVKVGDAVRFSKIASQGIAIGHGDSFIKYAAKHNLSHYGGMPGYKTIEKAVKNIPFVGKTLNNMLGKLGWANNYRFIKNVMDWGGKIYDAGGPLIGAYAKEVAMLLRYFNFIR